jgi:hypothetical protein
MGTRNVVNLEGFLLSGGKESNEEAFEGDNVGVCYFGLGGLQLN